MKDEKVGNVDPLTEVFQVEQPLAVKMLNWVHFYGKALCGSKKLNSPFFKMPLALCIWWFTCTHLSMVSQALKIRDARR